MKNVPRILALALASSALVIYFQNCSAPLPPSMTGPDTFDSTSGGAGGGALAASANPPALEVGQAAQINASGGSQPYTYVITEGTATINASGVVEASTTGAVVVEVTDQAGNTADTSLTFETPGSMPSTNPGGSTSGSTGTSGGSTSSGGGFVIPTTCTTPWGQVVPTGTKVTGFTTKTVSCPNHCQTVTFECLSGTLVNISGHGDSAVSGSCSIRPCTYQLYDSQSCGSGDDTALPIVPATCTAPGETLCAASSSSGIFNTIGNLYECVAPR